MASPQRSGVEARTVRLGAGMAFWGDRIQPAVDMVTRADIDYLCCDHLAELTMSILAKARRRNPELGYTSDLIPLLRAVLPTAHARGIRVVTNGGGANPAAAGRAVVALARELGLTGLTVAVVTGDELDDRVDDLLAAGVDLRNLDTGQALAEVRDRLTHASAYAGADGIVEALEAGADVVVCGRVTDIALYLGPMRHELGWPADDWYRLGAGTVVAHAIECGGQATGGLYAADWAGVPGLEDLGYPIAQVSEDGTAVITKTPDSGGRVDIGTLSEQLVYEILDPAAYLTADVTADFTGVRLEEIGLDRVRLTGGTGRERPATLKVNAGYRAGFVGEARFTYTWPDALAKAERGLAFLRNRLALADFQCSAEFVDYPGLASMWGPRVQPPDDPDLPEITVRYAARCPNEEEARKVFTESVPLYNNGPAGVAGVGTRPPLKELYAVWPALVPRELVTHHVELVTV